MACQPCWVRCGPDSFPWGWSSLACTSDLFSCSPGDLGGHMGLFIGASILTLLEILDYIYEARDGGLVGGPLDGGWRLGGGAVGKAAGRWRCSTGFLVQSAWLQDQAWGLGPGSPDGLEGVRVLRS